MNELQQEYYDKINTCAYIRDRWTMSTDMTKLNQAYHFLLTPELIQHFDSSVNFNRPKTVGKYLTAIKPTRDFICYQPAVNGRRKKMWCRPTLMHAWQKANSSKVATDAFAKYFPKLGETFTDMPDIITEQEVLATPSLEVNTSPLPAISREEFIEHAKLIVLDGEIPSYWFHAGKLNASLVERVKKLGYAVLVRDNITKSSKVSEPINIPQAISDEAEGLLPIIGLYYERITKQPLWSKIDVPVPSTPVWPPVFQSSTYETYQYINDKVFDYYKPSKDAWVNAAIYIGWYIKHTTLPDDSLEIDLLPRRETVAILGNAVSASSREVPYVLPVPKWDEPTKEVKDFLTKGLSARHFHENLPLCLLIFMEVYKRCGLIVDVRAGMKK